MIKSKRRVTSTGSEQVPYNGPSAAAMTANVFKATGRVIYRAATIKSIFVEPEVETWRLSICERCHLWQPDARMGMGKCTHKSCGCTKIKHKLVTESCPLGKWSRVDNRGILNGRDR
jgi:hypothetical protein